MAIAVHLLPRLFALLLVVAVFCVLPASLAPGNWLDGAALAKGGSGGDDDDDDDDNSGSGSGGGNSGSGSGNSGSGSNNSGSGSGNSGSGSGNSGKGSSNSGPGSGSGSGSARGSGSDDLFRHNMLAVHFTDGRTQRIASGVYEATDRRGRVVERHRATRGDLDRLRNLRSLTARAKRAAGVVTVTVVNTAQGALQAVDSGGWVEELKGGRYVLRDPNGNTVVQRRATGADLARLKAWIGQP